MGNSIGFGILGRERQTEAEIETETENYCAGLGSVVRFRT